MVAVLDIDFEIDTFRAKNETFDFGLESAFSKEALLEPEISRSISALKVHFQK